MQETTDPRNIERRVVDETNATSAQGKTGVGSWFGVGLGIWTVVILVALVFVVAILVFAL